MTGNKPIPHNKESEDEEFKRLFNDNIKNIENNNKNNFSVNEVKYNPNPPND